MPALNASLGSRGSRRSPRMVFQVTEGLAPGSPETPVQPPTADTPGTAGQPFQPRPDPLLAHDLTPWLLRRLTLATAMARELRQAELLVLRG